MSEAAERSAALFFKVLCGGRAFVWGQPPSAVRRAQPSRIYCLGAIVASQPSPSRWKSGPF